MTNALGLWSRYIFLKEFNFHELKLYINLNKDKNKKYNLETVAKNIVFICLTRRKFKNVFEKRTGKINKIDHFFIIDISVSNIFLQYFYRIHTLKKNVLYSMCKQGRIKGV